MTVLDDRAEALADQLHNAAQATAELADARDQVTRCGSGTREAVAGEPDLGKPGIPVIGDDDDTG